MDKNEYRIKADEIKTLIAQGEYQQAAEIADTIDWRRVKSVMMLCTISDLYKINRRYEDSRDILLLAYDRHPGGRTIVYSLCELSIKIEDYVMAIEYYKEFVQIAPRDTGRYILQYKLYQAQDVSLEERIAVLEELKTKDYREKWAYELAYLYHRVGLATKCIEECDELILWFGEGKYVVKAMELKMLHQPLTDEQQGRYDSRFQSEPVYEEGEPYYGESEPVYEESQGQEDYYYPETAYEAEEQGMAEEAQSAVQPEDVLHAPTIRIPSEEIEIQVKTMDVGQYNTINLQKELAEGLREVLEDEEPQDAVTRSIIAPMMEGDGNMADNLSEGPQEEQFPEEAYSEGVPEEQMETEVFFGATGEIGDLNREQSGALPREELTGEEVYTQDDRGEYPAEETSGEEESTDGNLAGEDMGRQEKERTSRTGEPIPAKTSHSEEKPAGENAAEGTLESAEDQTAAIVMEQLRMQNLGIEPPKEMAGVLSMESDGQISLVVPESEKVEKQITGQMRIEDILAEWERMKRNNEEKRREAIHQKVLRQTGPMFTAFEESIRDGLLEQLEQGAEPEEILAAAGKAADMGEAAAEDVVEESEEAFIKEESEEDFYGEESELEEQPGDESWEEEQEEAFYEEESETGGSLEEEFLEEEPEMEEPAEEAPYEEEPEEGLLEEAPYEEELEGEGPIEEAPYEEEPEEEGLLEEAPYEEELEGEGPIEEAPCEEGLVEEGLAEEAPCVEEFEEELVEEVLYEEETVEEGQPEESHEEDSNVEETDRARPTEEESRKEKPAGKRRREKTIQKEPIRKESAQEEENASQEAPSGREKPRVRALTREEKELYGSFIQSRSSKEKLIAAIDSISMASYTGNVVITGDEGMDTMTLAKNMIREVQMTDSNFSGKIAKISGSSFNQRNVTQTLDGLANGALIIQKASQMDRETADALYKALQQEKYGLIVIMEDTRKAMNKFLGVYAKLAECFNARMDMEALSNDSLVAFGKKYAREMEYSIDELGILALHTRIAEMQTSDHVVTIKDVKGIMDEAIRHANRKSMGHFVDILLAKRYDEEDMIILRENDFIY
ncbi:MAG: hypothetical protein HFH81_08520 [Lachnospiraceae bacterium]|nr:hypothetical protein [Lachnospiraceae bacterium]